MTAKKSSAKKATAAKKKAPVVTATPTPAPAAPVAETPKAPVPSVTSGAVLGEKMKALFAEARATISAPHDGFPKTPRMLRLALSAIDMAELACERHLKHNG